jgi:glutamate dehydrogenase (NADP+)
LKVIKQIKEVERARISKYAELVPGAKYIEGKGVWRYPCDVALPCATQNELTEEDAGMLIDNGCKFVAEGANIPCTPEAITLFHDNKIYFAPGKASNAGGVATSGIEMAQNSSRLPWSFDEVDRLLKKIMKGIYKTVTHSASEFGEPDNLEMGANIAGFQKIIDAMLRQGNV